MRGSIGIKIVFFIVLLYYTTPPPSFEGLRYSLRPSLYSLRYNNLYLWDVWSPASLFSYFLPILIGSNSPIHVLFPNSGALSLCQALCQYHICSSMESLSISSKLYCVSYTLCQIRLLLCPMWLSSFLNHKYNR